MYSIHHVDITSINYIIATRYITDTLIWGLNRLTVNSSEALPGRANIAINNQIIKFHQFKFHPLFPVKTLLVAIASTMFYQLQGDQYICCVLWHLNNSTGDKINRRAVTANIGHKMVFAKM